MNALMPSMDFDSSISKNGPVLVIDDSLTIRKLLEMTLQRAGHAYEVAALGQQGLDLARRLRPKLILLDYILPDLKGTEVCDELARDPLTQGIPVVVMSGKGDDIRPLFKARRAVLDVIAKPFAPAEIQHVIARALSRAVTPPVASQPSGLPVLPVLPVQAATPSVNLPSGAATAAPGTGSFVNDPGERSRREAAAKVLFSAFRDRLSRIPEWLAEAGAQAPAAFLARRLFTAEAMGTVLQGLTPLVAPAPAAPPSSSSFSGNTGFLSFLPLLRVVADAHRTGVLYVGDKDGVEVWFDRGELRLVAPRGVIAARRVLVASGISEEPGKLLSQNAELAPAIAAVFAASDHLQGLAVLHQHGRQVLLQLTADGPLPWSWHDRDRLPSVVEQAGLELTIDQLHLDRLRLVDDWSQIELEVRSLDQCCARAADFRARLPLFTLTVEETQVLLLVDGRTPVKHILTRLAEQGQRLSTFEVFHILYRLIQVRLITANPQLSAQAGAVVLCHDRSPGESLATALATWLGQRGDELVLCTPDNLRAVLLELAPRLVLVDVVAPQRLAALASEVRQCLEISALLLAALVDHPDRKQQRCLSAAGYDRVLTRPIPFSALARLLQGRGGAALSSSLSSSLS
jgi:DNA-binding response OmpR family regulator